MNDTVGDLHAQPSECDEASPGRQTAGRTAVYVAVTIWFVLIAIGSGVLLRYQNSPGAPADLAVSWIETAPFRPSPGVATLLMFAHPRCPCTRASIGELARLMARGKGRVEAHVLFFEPASVDDAWVQTDLWTSAAAIPGVQVRPDPEGRLARMFGAQTSGQTALYASDGTLLFRGGITASRGHAGDNVGRTTILSLLDDPQAAAVSTPVFGCYLRSPEVCGEEDEACQRS